MIRIGNVDINGRTVLAPMAGVTDVAFRQLCREQGAALTVTEMISSKALSFGDKHTRDLMRIGEGEHPVAVQIFGHEPELMGEMAQKAAEESGCDIIDINMGCPVGKIACSGDGSGLMKTPELARDIIEQCVKHAGVPVTVKFRKGWDKGSVIAVEFGIMAQEAGAAAIAVHGRTRTQMYEGKADWDIVRDVKRAVTIPVAANGDVFSGADAAHILAYTGCDLVMIGRGVFGNPWIFRDAEAAIAGEEIPSAPTLSEKMDMALHHAELSASLRNERVACLEARRHLSWYLKGIPYSGYLRSLAVKVETIDDIRAICETAKKELN